MATIIKRGRTYKITVSLGYKNGKQERRHKTWIPEPGKSEKQADKEANHEAALFEEQCLKGLYFDANTTLQEFSDMWLEQYAEKQLRANTIDGYRILMRRINEKLGHIKLGKLQPHHLLEFYNLLTEADVRSDLKYIVISDLASVIKSKGYTHKTFAKASGISTTTIFQAIHGKHISASSVRAFCNTLDIKQKDYFSGIGSNQLSNNTVVHYHKLLSTMFTAAVQWQLIPSNPCSRVKPPRAEHKEAKYLDDKEVIKLFDCLENVDTQFKTFVYIALYTGMRRAELCGLKWDDIDFEQEVLHIQRNLLYTAERGLFFDETKTTSSNRVIKLPKEAVNILKTYKAWQNEKRLSMGDKWHNSDMVFTAWDGLMVIPNTMSSRFKNFIAKSDLPDISLHSLRHTNATLMIMNGTNIKTVSSRLGHSATSITGDIYVHAIKTADEIAADTLNEIFASARQPNAVLVKN